MSTTTAPTEPGWYIARMKTWSIHDGWAVVKATRNGSADPLRIWQAADTRPWPVDAWDWGRRVYPDVERLAGVEGIESSSSTGVVSS